MSNRYEFLYLGMMLLCGACMPVAQLKFSPGTRGADKGKDKQNGGNQGIILHEAYTVMNKYCLSCHAWVADLNTDQKWIDSGRVVAGDADSVLLLYLKHGPTTLPLDQQMPRAGSPASAEFSVADYEVIREWVMNMNRSGGGNANSHEVTLPLNSTIRLGDRHMVSSVLEAIFGPGGKASIHANIRKSVASFGGACDPRSHATDIESISCYVLEPDSYDIAASAIVVSNPRRESLRLKTCRELAYDDVTLRFAMENVKTSTYVSSVFSSSTAVVPSVDDIRDVYQLFYPGVEPSSGILNSLSNLAVEAADSPLDARDPWRYVFLTVCYGADWQAY